MLECKIKDIESAAKEILNLAEKRSDLSFKFQELQASLQCESLSYCLEKYINSELDSKTPGDRGLGRMTTVIPRLGAYYRKQMSRLQSEDLSELYGLIQRIILIAYLVRPFFVEKPLSKPKLSEKKLYKAWIPTIYSGDNPLSESVLDTIDAFTYATIESLFNFFTKYKMEKNHLLGKDKKMDILFGYYVAGYYLRIVETDKEDKFSNIC